MQSAEIASYKPVLIARCPSRLVSSGWGPLLAPSPLRTGLGGFPSSGSSSQKRPLEKRGRGLIQSEADLLDTDLLPIRAAVEKKIHQSCLKLHQRVAPSSFALLHTSVPQEFSSLSTNRKSAPFPAR